MKKNFTLSFAVALSLAASAQSLKVLSCTDEFPSVYEPQLMGLGISPDGKYACGAVSWGAGVFAADIQTGQVKWEAIDDDEGGELRHIDNYGVALGLAHTYVFDTGELSVSVPPAGYRAVLNEDLTNDGSLIVGSLSSSETHAAYHKVGEDWHLLPIPPDDELFGLAPKFDNTSAAKHVSADGDVIFGFLGSFFIPTLWYRNDAGGYDYDFFLSRFLKFSNADLNDDSKPLYGVSAHYIKMSNNGRYVSMIGIIVDEEGNDKIIPVVYDTKNKEIKLYTEKQEIDDTNSGLYPTAISDDGTFIGCVGMPYYGSTGSFIMRAGETEAELFVDAFPEYYELLGESDYLGFSMPTSISADGKKILGYTYYADDYNDTETPALYVTYVISTDSEDGVEQISGAPSSARAQEIYSIDGRSLNHMTKGLNIVRNADGSVTKILNK
ncbi:MAG: hypothetical protein K2H38_07215 [Muribaculaceae bacterium]|nr:hypothetical protein [Muribaculaceae bacterium]MDE6554312.1 hypothetical protein [Muribaculaceae bacterium]